MSTASSSQQGAWWRHWLEFQTDSTRCNKCKPFNSGVKQKFFTIKSKEFNFRELSTTSCFIYSMKQVTWPLANEKTSRYVKKNKKQKENKRVVNSVCHWLRGHVIMSHDTDSMYNDPKNSRGRGLAPRCQNDPLPVLTGKQQEQWLQFHHVANRWQGGQSLMMSQTTESFRIHMEIKCKQSATATQQGLPVDDGKNKTTSKNIVSTSCFWPFEQVNRKWRQQEPILRPFQNKIPACDLDAGGGANKAASESVASQYWVSS